MRRDQQSAVVRTREFGDDATVVDYTAPERARKTLPSIDDVETQVRPPVFDDLPTTVWTPRSSKRPAVASPPRAAVSVRRLRGVVDEGPKVQVAPPSPRPIARLVVQPEAPSAWDEVTRIEVLKEEVRPVADAEATAKSRIVLPRRLSPVRIAIAAVALLLVAALAVAWHRTHPHGLALPASLAGRAPISAPVTAPVATANAAPAPAPATPGAPLSATSATSTPSALVAPVVVTPTVAASAMAGATVNQGAASSTNDELAAVEAVLSGDNRRAARLYSALALAHPTNEAYREAARILLERTKEARP